MTQLPSHVSPAGTEPAAGGHYLADPPGFSSDLALRRVNRAGGGCVV